MHKGCAHHFGPQELSNTLWAFAAAAPAAQVQAFRDDDAALRTAVRELFASAGGIQQSLSGQHLANIFWAAARLGPFLAPTPGPWPTRPRPGFSILGAARQRVAEMAPQHLAAVVWACAAAGGASIQSKRSGGYRDPELLTAVEVGTVCRMSAAWLCLGRVLTQSC